MGCICTPEFAEFSFRLMGLYNNLINFERKPISIFRAFTPFYIANSYCTQHIWQYIYFDYFG